VVEELSSLEPLTAHSKANDVSDLAGYGEAIPVNSIFTHCLQKRLDYQKKVMALNQRHDFARCFCP
jgi:hypothetical protein